MAHVDRGNTSFYGALEADSSDDSSWVDKDSISNPFLAEAFKFGTLNNFQMTLDLRC